LNVTIPGDIKGVLCVSHNISPLLGVLDFGGRGSGGGRFRFVLEIVVLFEGGDVMFFEFGLGNFFDSVSLKILVDKL